jgi:hypothetical protein
VKKKLKNGDRVWVRVAFYGLADISTDEEEIRDLLRRKDGLISFTVADLREEIEQ